jgi:hypothetical protein
MVFHLVDRWSISVYASGRSEHRQVGPSRPAGWVSCSQVPEKAKPKPGETLASDCENMFIVMAALRSGDPDNKVSFWF